MKRAILIAILALVAAGCGNGVESSPRIVVTTSILGDLVSTVAGSEATVEVLIPIGADPHEFQASSAQVAAMARAELVVANGLGLEEGLGSVFESLAGDGVPILEVAPQLDPLESQANHDEGEDLQEHQLDPHVWMDPLRMADAAGLVATELSRLDPDGGWIERAAAYAAELRRAHDQIDETLSAVPVERRALITNHATMGYFADRYGWEILRTVIPGGSTTGAPSSADLAELVALIRAEGATAIFVDTTRNDDLARAVAAEVGSTVEIVPLYTESLTDSDGAAPTLIDMLLFNAGEIARTLGG